MNSQIDEKPKSSLLHLQMRRSHHTGLRGELHPEAGNSKLEL